MGSCKSQRSSHALDRGPRSASLEECLPQELLEAILGKLDRHTLCTARLVSRTFCAVASANISSVTLRSPSQAVSLERFPSLGHVRVHVTGNDDSLAQLDPRLCAVMTQLTIRRPHDRVGCLTLPGFPGMPKLRELEVDPDAHVDGAAVLHRLANLEVLRIGDCTPPVAMTIVTATWLTSLVIGWVTGPGEMREFADFSWLQHATSLRRLQALQISISHEALPLIGNLTGLTGLTWFGDNPGSLHVAEIYSIVPLFCLKELRSLEIGSYISESDLAIACSWGSGSLTKLSLWVGWRASADCGRLLARQTALAELAVGGEQLSNLRHMGGLRMEFLQSLELRCVRTVDAEGLDVLQRATSLTKLIIGTFFEQPHERFGQTLGRLTQLRSLHLDNANRAYTTNLNLPLALGPLTALTELQLSDICLENGELRALLGLTGLQVLDLQSCGLTDDLVPELGVLTNLRLLTLHQCAITSLAPATNILNPLRQARGWPPVDAYLSW